MAKGEADREEGSTRHRPRMAAQVPRYGGDEILPEGHATAGHYGARRMAGHEERHAVHGKNARRQADGCGRSGVGLAPVYEEGFYRELFVFERVLVLDGDHAFPSNCSAEAVLAENYFSVGFGLQMGCTDHRWL